MLKFPLVEAIKIILKAYYTLNGAVRLLFFEVKK